MRTICLGIAALTLTAQNTNHELGVSDYELSMLGESMLQTYITAGMSIEDLKKTEKHMQAWFKK